MVYTQARLDEALSAFRECKKFLERRGLKTANLETHLGRKYELRRPPPALALAPRPTLWLFRDDDSDGEFDPSNGKKKKKNVIHKPRIARTPKRKLYSSGEDSGRKPKGITYSRGRQEGRELIVKLKLTKPENLEVFNRLFPRETYEFRKMPQEQPTNVFNANHFDSGFELISPSKGNDARDISEFPDGTIVDPLTGLVTPRGSVSSIEALQAATPKSVDLIGSTDEHTRGLRNRVVSVSISPSKKLRSCLTCKEEGSKCSLVKCHPEYMRACDACESAGLACRIKEDDFPRRSPLDRLELESENRKRSAEGDESRGSKRRKSGNMGSTCRDYDDESSSGLGKSMMKKRKKIYEYDEDSSSGLGQSMLKKRNTSETNNLELINKLSHTGRSGFSGRDFEGSSSLAVDTALANSSSPPSKSSDSGYHSSFLTNIAQKLNINMGNALDTAISVSSSPPISPMFYLDASPSRSFSAKPTDSGTSHITTPWAHPINFQHRPKTTGEPCHFCQDFRYGLVGHGPITVEVFWDQGEKDYIEINGGHFGMGKEPTRMCGACALERLRIRFCGYEHDETGKGKAKATSNKTPHHHQLIEVPSWRALGATQSQKWRKQLRMDERDAEYSAKPVMPPCHLCNLPATYRCGTLQKRNRALQPLQGDQTGAKECGLRVCDGCRDNVEGCGGEWVRGKVLGVGERADADFLFEGAALERSKVWGEYLGSVGLML